MKSRISPAATNHLLTALAGGKALASSLEYLFRNGADPWATTPMGSSVLDLCLRDGRSQVATAWANAARETLATNTFTRTNPLADQRVVDLVTSAAHMEPSARQTHLRRFLFNPEKQDDHHAFIRSMFADRHPQIWSVLSSMLLLRPQLKHLPVPGFVDHNADTQNEFFTNDHDIVKFFSPQPTHFPSVLIDEFVANAPNQVLFKHLQDRRHNVELDWRKNPAIVSRLRLFLSEQWAWQWKELQDVRAVFVGLNDKQENVLHQYLKTTPPQDLTVAALETLCHYGNQWEQRNTNGITCTDRMNKLLATGNVPKEVAETFAAQTTARPTVSFRAFAM